MKLKDLKPVLNSQKVNLYLEVMKPIKFEIWDNEEYRKINEIDKRVGDTMYLDYGEHQIEQIYSEDSETVNIDLANI
ncbi:hypothetical protein NHI66_000641 [Clostridium botulinum]|nr:hypothetical protein [Clostridium botulinum]